ncbi:MAG TPA: hypothetical protein GXX37_10775 [Clostridiaceae bacterium]|nr:hypothetical protein [Clostridiaceae bacterium]
MKYSSYVDPFYGNFESDLPKPEGIAARWFFLKAQTGNTHPGAVMPFGMVSAAPYTGGYPTGYSPYWFNYYARPERIMDPEHLKIYGFSHFHQSGTGSIGQYYNYCIVTPFIKDIPSRFTTFFLKDEHAHPGYYSGCINNIKAELTVTKGAAIHRYSFPGDEENFILFDLQMNGLVRNGEMLSSPGNIEFLDVSEKSFYALSKYDDVPLYVCVYCPQATEVKSLHDSRIVMRINGRITDVAIGFSFASFDHAKRHCLDSMNQGFDATVEQAKQVWEYMLSFIEVEGPTESLQKFYSNLYHTLIKPIDITNNSHFWNDAPCMVDLATLWDMYKVQLPLIFMLYKETGRKIVLSMLRSIKKFGYFPNCLLLTPPEPISNQAYALSCLVLYDAFTRKLKGIDWAEVLFSMVHELRRPCYNQFYRNGVLDEYPSHTLDLVAACHATVQLARELGYENIATEFSKYTNNWKNVFDLNTGLLIVNGKYYEGSHWNYSFRLLPDMHTRIALSRDYLADLDRFFGYGCPPVTQCTDPKDLITMKEGEKLNRFEGFNNETDMETPYAYDYINRIDRVAEIVRSGEQYMFSLGRGALPGNNDSGGLSACYVMNALGLFPVAGQPIFLLGSPAVNKAKIHLHNGNTFEIEAIDNGKNNIYPTDIKLNGKPLNRLILTVDEIMKGGKLSMKMFSLPQKTPPMF